MAVPFSNTHLRVPRGFATILEGLAREVLRNQPEDIPAYAALYFNGLLKDREESGMDPAEWAAKLEDRFYNNHAFKASPAKEPAPEVTTSSEEKSSESQTEGESEDESPSTAVLNVSEEVHATENKGEEEKDEKLRKTEEDVISTEMELSQESDNRLPVTDVRSDELSGTEEEKDPTITIPDQVDTAANENDSGSSLDKDICQSELEPTDLSSFSGNSNVDVCSEELGKIEDRGSQTYQKLETKDGDEEIRESTGEEQSAEFEEPMEEFPYSGLADVNVCAEELGKTDATVEGATGDDDPSDVHTAQQESSIPQMEEAIVKASLSQTEAPEANLQELDDQAEETVEGEGIETEPCSGETHDILATTENALEQMPQTEEVLDSDAAPKEEALVEISFEDVPEVSEIVEKQPVEEDLVESSQTEVLEMQHHEESEEFTEVETDHNIHSTQDHDEPETEVVENEVQTEGDRTSQQEAEDTEMEKVDTIDSNSSDSDDDERGEGVKNISSSQQPTTEAEGENLEDETDHNSEDQDNKEISESESHQIEYSEIEETKFETNDPVIKDDEKIAMGGEDIEDIETQGFRELEEKISQEIDDGSAETSLLQANHSNVSTPEKEAESETVEESAEILPDESEESEKTPVKLQPEDTEEEIEVKSEQPVSEAEELLEEGTIESEGQGKIEAACEEGSVGPTPSADQTDDDNLEEHRPLGSEKDTAEPEGKRDDKQEECSRPQEEEDIMDIPLDDPEANKAAAKIQAGFRGHMTRKKMKPEDKAEGEEVSSTGEALNGSQGDTETGGSGAVERDDTSIPEQ